MGLFSSIGGGILNAGLGILSSNATDKATRQYRDALMRNISANDAAAANITAQARGFQQAAEGSMAKQAAETNAQNRNLQAMGASSASAAAQAQASQNAIADLASKGAQQTLATSVKAQSDANNMNNQIRGKVADIAKDHISDVQQMYKGVGEGINGIAGMLPW